MITVGERIVYNNWINIPIYVKDVIIDTKTNRTRIILDWGTFGESVTYLHDEGVSWYRYRKVN
jgi:hypothetical protein